MRWPRRSGGAKGLGEKISGAHHFYAAIALSTGLGIVLDFAHVNPVRALFLTAVINGVLAPFLLVAILIVACDDKLMQGQPSPGLSRWAVGITALVMFGAAIAMFTL
jgi:Mn2+/Fe2+ NRAMP family transporter